MPIPKPKDGEKEKDFISRCMSNDTMKEEYPDDDQRLAVCYSTWRKAKESNESKAAPTDFEVRDYDVELRVARAEDKPPRIEGHAAVFDKKSVDLGGFVEIVKPGAFARTLKTSDVRGLFNHDRNFVLGRMSAGTLRMTEDSRGLLFDNDPPDTQWARDLLVSIERGDISQMSFSFRAVKEQWDESAKPVLRSLLDVDLADAGPVTMPAYPQTDVKVRSLLVSAGIDWDALGEAMINAEPTPEDRAVIQSAIAVLSGYLERGGGGALPEAGHIRRLASLKRQLEIAAT